jgi:hypothetical protein
MNTDLALALRTPNITEDYSQRIVNDDAIESSQFKMTYYANIVWENLKYLYFLTCVISPLAYNAYSSIVTVQRGC